MTYEDAIKQGKKHKSKRIVKAGHFEHIKWMEPFSKPMHKIKRRTKFFKNLEKHVQENCQQRTKYIMARANAVDKSTIPIHSLIERWRPLKGLPKMTRRHRLSGCTRL